MQRVSRFFVLAMMIVTGMCTFPSCYTYGAISERELLNGYPKTEQAVRITLKDGSIIDSPEYLHIVINEQSNVVVGIGQERSIRSMVFKGIVKTTDLDSIKKVPTTDGDFLVCWMKGKSSIAFREGEYLMLTWQDRLGFWCAGRRTTRDSTSNFRGLVARDRIAGIETKEFDYDTIKTAALIGLPTVAVLVVVGLMVGGLAYK